MHFILTTFMNLLPPREHFILLRSALIYQASGRLQ